MKPKTNRTSKKDGQAVFDRCQTPYYALDPLLPYLSFYWQIWEPAMGNGNIVQKLTSHQYQVVGTDILTGQNFFEYTPSAYDCIVTNPPYSLKYEWMERCYGLGKPFALLIPVESIGTAKAQRLMERYGFELILLNRRINFDMPNKGTSGSAQFPVLWFTWGLNIGQQITFGTIVYYDNTQTRMELTG